MHISLSILAIAMGLGMGLPQIYGIVKPKEFAVAVQKFPRSVPIGAALMLLATAWFLYYLKQEALSDFSTPVVTLGSLKLTSIDIMALGFAAVGIGSCLFVQDFLAVRGLSVVFLLLAKLMVDTARWAATDWRLVIVLWAYVLVLGGMWFTIWPWHMRDLLNFATANEKRVRYGSAVRFAFGMFVAILGFTVFRVEG